jgi:hypothetical protein
VSIIDNLSVRVLRRRLHAFENSVLNGKQSVSSTRAVIQLSKNMNISDSLKLQQWLGVLQLIVKPLGRRPCERLHVGLAPVLTLRESCTRMFSIIHLWIISIHRFQHGTFSLLKLPCPVNILHLLTDCCYISPRWTNTLKQQDCVVNVIQL